MTVADLQSFFSSRGVYPSMLSWIRACLRPIATRFGYETLADVPTNLRHRICLTPILETNANSPGRWIEPFFVVDRVALKLRTVSHPESVVHVARTENKRVWIDAEDVDQTDYERAWVSRVLENAPPRTRAVVVETVACYRRDALDHVQRRIEYAIRHDKRHAIKLVKGAYPRRPSVHWTRKAETDACLLACIEALGEPSVPIDVVVASHDPMALYHALERIPPSRLELSYLKGLEPRAIRDIRARGDPVPMVVYAPLGSVEEMVPYLVRRARESPYVLHRAWRELWDARRST